MKRAGKNKKKCVANHEGNGIKDKTNALCYLDTHKCLAQAVHLVFSSFFWFDNNIYIIKVGHFYTLPTHVKKKT